MSAGVLMDMDGDGVLPLSKERTGLVVEIDRDVLGGPLVQLGQELAVDVDLGFVVMAALLEHSMCQRRRGSARAKTTLASPAT